MARTYKRDSRGRFAGGGGGGSSSRGPARVGRSGPRGGKVGSRTEQRRNAREQAARTAAFHRKATGAGRSAREAYKAAASAARTARKNGAVTVTSRGGGSASTGARPPRIADTLRATLRTMAQSDARFYREVEQITGQPLRVPKSTAAPRLPGSGSGQTGSIAGALRSSLRRLAQADAARLRGIADITQPTSSGSLPGSGSRRKGVSGTGSSKALPGSSTSRRRRKSDRKKK